jgi:O-antigen polymerase
MLAFAFARVSKAIHQNHFRYTKALARLLPILYVSLGAVLTVTSLKLYIWNRDWKKAYTDGVYGAAERSQQEYRRLAESPLAYNEFYYNWAYMLMRNHKTKDAVRVINKCKIIDYDTQMLKGELSASLGDIKHALQYYNQASEMCPSKFMPLFAQFNLYEQLGMHEKKLDIGHKILRKKGKKTSTTTRNIKEKVFYSIYK